MITSRVVNIQSKCSCANIPNTLSPAASIHKTINQKINKHHIGMSSKLSFIAVECRYWIAIELELILECVFLTASTLRYVWTTSAHLVPRYWKDDLRKNKWLKFANYQIVALINKFKKNATFSCEYFLKNQNFNSYWLRISNCLILQQMKAAMRNIYGVYEGAYGLNNIKY